MKPFQNGSIVDPKLTDVLIHLKQDIFASLNCVKVGEIVSFDPTTKTAEIQILFKRVLPDKTIQRYPLLVDCPVFTLQGGGGALQFPVSAGDQCIVLFSDRRLDEWFENGGEAAPGDSRMHDMSDGIAIVGINSKASDLAAPSTSKVVLSYEGSRVEVDAAGMKLIGVGGAEVDLQAALVTIKNSTTTLLTLINGLITVIEGIQVTGPLGLTPASVSALEAYKTVLATLLQ